MGVEYEHYLIPEDNTFRPSPEQVSGLVGALLEGGFVAESGTETLRRLTFDAKARYEHAKRTGCYAHVGGRGHVPFPCPSSSEDVTALGGQDFRLVWPVKSSNESGLKYPLTPFPEWGDAYYDLEVRVADDFVYHTSQLIEPFDEVACSCGRPLEYFEHDRDEDFDRPPVFYDGRIRRSCPSCGSPFRPQERIARVRDGYTGMLSDRAGGVTYLFAVVVDCGKGFAREGWPMRATEQFMGTLTRALGQRFYEVGDIY